MIYFFLQEESVIPNFYEPPDENSDEEESNDPPGNLISADLSHDDIYDHSVVNDDVFNYTFPMKKSGSIRGRKRRGRPPSRFRLLSSPRKYTTRATSETTTFGSKSPRGRKKKRCPHCSHCENECKKAGVADSTDGCLIYGRHVGNELRHISDPDAMSTTKAKINAILLEAKEGMYNRSRTNEEISEISSHRVKENEIRTNEVIPTAVVTVEHGDTENSHAIMEVSTPYQISVCQDNVTNNQEV